MYVLMKTTDLTEDLLALLPLYLELQQESPLSRADGSFIPYEEVVTQLSSDTLKSDTYIGSRNEGQFKCADFSQTLIIHIKVRSRWQILDPEEFLRK